MPDRYVIDGVPPYDGEYILDVDEQPLTTNEWGWIKRRAGYLPLTLVPEAWGDPELIAVLAAIAIRRAGTVENRDMDGLLDRLFDAPFGGTIRLEADKAEQDDAGPPPGSSASRPSFNGDSSTTGSESSDVLPPPTGVPPLATSESVPATSAS